MLTRTTLALLASAILCAPAPCQKGDPDQPKPEPGHLMVAALGISTRAPTKQETEDLGLEIEVRVRGQIVTRLAENGAANKAGIQIGDVLIELDRNEIFSRDDIEDFLAVASPGQKVEATRQRREGAMEEKISLPLGREQVRAPFLAAIEWQYASLGQLPDALARARKEGKPVLLGLSGAET